MQGNIIDLSNAETEADVKKVLEEFRTRSGIVIKQPDYQEYRWCEDNVRRYMEEVRQNGKKILQRKLFYLAETGDVGQNDRLIAAVVWLKCNHFLGETEIERILEDNPPLLRVQVMEETEPGACEFRERTFDLVETAIECKSKTVLKRLLPHIDFARYECEDI